jgi:uncharacterized membrane protein YoaT (DUF817 family)
MEKWSKAAHVLNFDTTLESMRTLYHHLDSKKERVFFARIGGWVYPTPGVFAVASIVIPAFAGSRAAVVQTLIIQFTDWYIPHNFY